MFPFGCPYPYRTLHIKLKIFVEVMAPHLKVNLPPSRVGESTGCNHPSHHIERNSVVDDGVERVGFAVNGVVAGLT